MGYLAVGEGGSTRGVGAVGGGVLPPCVPAVGEGGITGADTLPPCTPAVGEGGIAEAGVLGIAKIVMLCAIMVVASCFVLAAGVTVTVIPTVTPLSEIVLLTKGIGGDGIVAGVLLALASLADNCFW